MVKVAEIGMIYTPIGMNVFVLAGAAGVIVGTIYRVI
jgi:hypothetical protein